MDEATPTSFDGAPAPVANFIFSPADPTTSEGVEFSDSSYDPAEAGVGTARWDFGDGASATGSFPSHRYPADGDYRARLTVTTADGRTASAMRIVSVRTPAPGPHLGPRVSEA